MQTKEGIKITLRAYDKKIIDEATRTIIETVKRKGATVKGPTPLPTKIKKFCVIKGPHVDSRSKEHFEIQVHKRLLIIIPTPQTVDALMGLTLPAGVDIKIALNGVK